MTACSFRLGPPCRHHDSSSSPNHIPGQYYISSRPLAGQIASHRFFAPCPRTPCFFSGGCGFTMIAQASLIHGIRTYFFPLPPTAFPPNLSAKDPPCASRLLNDLGFPFPFPAIINFCDQSFPPSFLNVAHHKLKVHPLPYFFFFLGNEMSKSLFTIYQSRCPYEPTTFLPFAADVFPWILFPRCSSYSVLSLSAFRLICRFLFSVLPSLATLRLVALFS